MTRSLEPKKIKSAHRALEVLEYFNSHRSTATVMDIARAMGCPQSSTSELLSYLVALGYLHRDRYTRTYWPSARVALLGAWVQPQLFRQGQLLPMMDDLAEGSGCAVVLAAKMGVALQYIHVVRALEATVAPPTEGSTAPLLHAALGKVLLAACNRDQVRALVHRINAERADGVPPFACADYVAELDGVCARRYSVSYEEAGGGILGVLLPRRCTGSNLDEHIALGLFGPSDVIRQKEESLIRMMRSAIARRFGTVRIVGQASAPPASSIPISVPRPVIPARVAAASMA